MDDQFKMKQAIQRWFAGSGGAQVLCFDCAVKELCSELRPMFPQLSREALKERITGILFVMNPLLLPFAPDLKKLKPASQDQAKPPGKEDRG